VAILSFQFAKAVCLKCSLPPKGVLREGGERSMIKKNPTHHPPQTPHMAIAGEEKRLAGSSSRTDCNRRGELGERHGVCQKMH